MYPNPKVSVIIPVYNGEKYIEEAIKSVQSQTLENWEVIIVDDGSTDSTLEILSNLIQTESRIHLFHHEGNVNKGVSETRNLALSHCSGQYIALLDCDDYWNPHKLEVQSQILDQNITIGIVYCLLETKFESKFDFPKICGTYSSSGIIDHSFSKVLQGEVWIPNSSALIRKSLIHKTTKYRRLKCNEDQLFFSEILCYSELYFVPQVFGIYRIHESSFTYNNNWNSLYYKYLIFSLWYIPLKKKAYVFKHICLWSISQLKLLLKNIG